MWRLHAQEHGPAWGNRNINPSIPRILFCGQIIQHLHLFDRFCTFLQFQSSVYEHAHFRSFSHLRPYLSINFAPYIRSTYFIITPNMHFTLLSLASILLGLASAQTASGSNPNPFKIPEGGYSLTAGQSSTISWTPTTSGTVTINLRDGASSDLDTVTVVACKLPQTCPSPFCFLCFCLLPPSLHSPPKLTHHP